MPRVAILTSTVVGFLCVIAAAVSPDTVFLFLLNSSGAIILFVYLLIAVSQVVLRRRTDPQKLIVRMWFFPVLSIATIAAIVGVLVQMYLNAEVRPQLLLSLLAWALVLVFYLLTRWRGGSVEPEAVTGAHPAERVLVLANETVAADELLDELRRIDRSGHAVYHVCVPAEPPGRAGDAPGGGGDARVEAAQARLDHTLRTLRSEGLHADGALGDARPMHALQAAVTAFRPDQLVISTHPEEHSTWLRHGVVHQARHVHSLPVTHVVSYVGRPVAP